MNPQWVEVVFSLPLKNSFTYQLEPSQTASLGARVVCPLGRREVTGIVVGHPAKAPEGVVLKKVKRVIDEKGLFGPRTLELGQWLARFTFSSLGECLFSMIPGGRREKSLEVWEDPVPQFQPPNALSDEQIQALEVLKNTDKTMIYLRGITGSGKTEVFLTAAQKALDLGKSVIYLVPEIALTLQLREVLKARFSLGLAVLHSSLTPSQKLKEWRRIQSGEARIVVGARSAIFAPVENLGLIIIDEEHEASYKSQNTPRFHARQVAQKLCQWTGAKMMMGSATPSMEAVLLMRRGDLQEVRLTRRLSGGALPLVSLVDMQKEKQMFSQILLERLRAVKEMGRQSILFLNRRGFTYFFHCKTCGHELTCHQCSVSLTYHKQKNALVCHYCGYQTRPVSVCPACGSLDMGFGGSGTEHVEEELTRLLPDIRLLRLDKDTVQTKGVLEKTLKAFEKGEADLLLGTQMVAKGFNFPKLKLVGLINADMGLSMPDFRAPERIFSLIRQVSGRTGRFLPDGEVLIQTHRPRHAAILWAAEGKDEEFYDQELSIRSMTRFPPYSRLIRLVFRSKSEETAWKSAEGVAQLFAPLLNSDVELLGPSECPLAMVSANHRVQILLRSQELGPLHSRLEQVLERFVPHRDVYLEIDVDPLSLL